jgi:hypothetical protein
MLKKPPLPAWISVVVLLAAVGLATPSASAATNQFRGVNWADPGDNFQSGVLYISGLSSSDTYDSALAVGNAVMSQFISKLGANAVRLPINEATVSKFWSAYTGAIDAVLSKGMVVFGYWDSAKSNKPADMNAFSAMWKTVVDKYGSNENSYFEIFNEPNMYSKTDLTDLYNSWLTQFPSIPKGRVILRLASSNRYLVSKRDRSEPWATSPRHIAPSASQHIAASMAALPLRPGS